MPVLTKINTNSIAEDAITGDKFAGDAYLANTANQNISGTYSENRLYTSDAYTLSGNATVNSHLTLSSVKPTADVVLTAGGAYTITGTGVLSGGSLLAKANTDLTGMTGELGSTVTGTPAITDAPALTGLGTVTSGTYNATIGSSATGFTGIKNFSYWYLNTSFGFSSGNNVWVSHWEEMQSTRGYTSLDIGGAMAGPSNGVFTFPSTGYWLIIFSCSGRGNSAAPTVTANIETATNAGSGDTYLDAARGYWFSTGDPTKEHTTVHFIFDVTSTTTHKCRFSVDVTAATYFECNGILQQNGATFIRLGDT